MGNNVVPFRAPDDPWIGAKRRAGIKAGREAAPAIASAAIDQAIRAFGHLPECAGLGYEDALPLLLDAFRDHLAKMPRGPVDQEAPHGR